MADFESPRKGQKRSADDMPQAKRSRSSIETNYLETFLDGVGNQIKEDHLVQFFDILRVKLSYNQYIPEGSELMDWLVKFACTPKILEQMSGFFAHVLKPTPTAEEMEAFEAELKKFYKEHKVQGANYRQSPSRPATAMKRLFLYGGPKIRKNDIPSPGPVAINASTVLSGLTAAIMLKVYAMKADFQADSQGCSSESISLKVRSALPHVWNYCQLFLQGSDLGQKWAWEKVHNVQLEVKSSEERREWFSNTITADEVLEDQASDVQVEIGFAPVPIQEIKSVTTIMSANREAIGLQKTKIASEKANLEKQILICKKHLDTLTEKRGTLKKQNEATLVAERMHDQNIAALSRLRNAHREVFAVETSFEKFLSTVVTAALATYMNGVEPLKEIITVKEYCRAVYAMAGGKCDGLVSSADVESLVHGYIRLPVTEIEQESEESSGPHSDSDADVSQLEFPVPSSTHLAQQQTHSSPQPGTSKTALLKRAFGIPVRPATTRNVGAKCIEGPYFGGGTRIYNRSRELLEKSLLPPPTRNRINETEGEPSDPHSVNVTTSVNVDNVHKDGRANESQEAEHVTGEENENQSAEDVNDPTTPRGGVSQEGNQSQVADDLPSSDDGIVSAQQQNQSHVADNPTPNHVPPSDDGQCSTHQRNPSTETEPSNVHQSDGREDTTGEGNSNWGSDNAFDEGRSCADGVSQHSVGENATETAISINSQAPEIEDLNSSFDDHEENFDLSFLGGDNEEDDYRTLLGMPPLSGDNTTGTEGGQPPEGQEGNGSLNTPPSMTTAERARFEVFD